MMNTLLRHHIHEGMSAAMYAMRGMESELPRMRAQAKLRLATLNDDEIRELAGMLTPKNATQMIDRNARQLLEQHDLVIRTAHEWIDDLFVGSCEFWGEN